MCFTWLHSFFVEISSWTDSDSGPRSSSPHTHKHFQLLTSLTLPILEVWLLRGWLGTFTITSSNEPSRSFTSFKNLCKPFHLLPSRSLLLNCKTSIFARVHRKLYWEPSWQSENRWRVEDDLFSLIVAWWRSSITQNTVHFCKARTSLKLSGKSWCVHCADKVATGTLSQLTMDNGNEELETHNTGNTNTETEYTRHSVSLVWSADLESWLISGFFLYRNTGITLH